MMKKISLLVIGFMVALWLGGKINAAFFSPDLGLALLSNRSSQAITSATISVCGQTYVLSGIPKGEFAAIRYVVTRDSHYDVLVTLQSGKTLKSGIGYVTNGFDFVDVIQVTDAKITHKSREVPVIQ